MEADKKVLDLYTKILKDLGIAVGEQGELLTRSGKQMGLEKRKLHLPTDQLLNDNDWSEIYPFHPLSENDLMGPSKVLSQYSSYLKLRTHIWVGKLLEGIIKVIKQPELSRKLKGTAITKLLSQHPQVKESHIEEVRKAVNRYNKAIAKEGHSPVTIRLSRIRGGKTEDGIKATRKAVLVTHYVDEKDKMSYHNYCNGMSKAAKGFMDKFMLISDISYVEYGDGPAAYFQALLKIQKRLTEELLPYLEELGRVDEELVVPEGDWFDYIADFKELADAILPLPGNEGIRLTQEASRAESDPMDGLADRDVARVEITPEPEPEPEVVVTTETERKEIDLDELDRSRMERRDHHSGYRGGPRPSRDPYLSDGDDYLDRRDRRDDRRDHRDDRYDDRRDYRDYRDDRRDYRDDRRRDDRDDRRDYRDDRRDHRDDRRDYRDDRRDYRDDRRDYRDDRRDDRRGGRDPYLHADNSGRRGV